MLRRPQDPSRRRIAIGITGTIIVQVQISGLSPGFDLRLTATAILPASNGISA